MRTDHGAPATDNPGFQQPAGTYARLLQRQCERDCAPDPRLLEEPEWAKLKAAGAIRAATMYDERLAAAKAIVVSGMDVGLRDSRIAETLRLHRDDFAEVISFYSGEMVDGRWELIELPARYRPNGHA